MRTDWQDPPPGGGPGGGWDSGGGMGGGVRMAMPSVTPAVRALLWANGLVFLASLLLFMVHESTWFAVRDLFGAHPGRWVDWFPFVPVWQLVSYGFLHDTTSLFHLGGNLLFLYFLGTMLEGIVGSRRFLVLYFSGMMLAGAAMVGLGVAFGNPTPTIGASGAVLCVVVATAALRPNARIIFILFPITLKTLAILYVVMDVFGILMEFKGAGGNVAYAAHLTGAAWGFWLARSGRIWRDPLESLERHRAQRQVQREVDDAQKLDQLLEKIQREGMHSLTSREKAFLKRSSQRR